MADSGVRHEIFPMPALKWKRLQLLVRQAGSGHYRFRLDGLGGGESQQRKRLLQLRGALRPTNGRNRKSHSHTAQGRRFRGHGGERGNQARRQIRNRGGMNDRWRPNQNGRGQERDLGLPVLHGFWQRLRNRGDGRGASRRGGRCSLRWPNLQRWLGRAGSGQGQDPGRFGIQLPFPGPGNGRRLVGHWFGQT